MRPSATAAVLAVAALAACSDPPAQACPGEPVGRFHFTGARVYTGDAVLAGLDPVPSIPDCPQDLGQPRYPATLPPFEGLLAADPSTQVAALCRPTGIVLFGQKTGSRYAVEGTTDGAVLACPLTPTTSTTCSAALRLVVVGDVTGGDADGVPLELDGLLVEVMTSVAGDCGTCLAPAQSCAARYTLQGTR